MKVFRENWINAFYCTDCISVLLYCVPPTGGLYSSVLFTLGHLRPRTETATSCNLSWCSHQYQQDTATKIKKERTGTPFLAPKFLLVFWVFKHFSPWLYTRWTKGIQITCLLLLISLCTWYRPATAEDSSGEKPAINTQCTQRASIQLVCLSEAGQFFKWMLPSRSPST